MANGNNITRDQHFVPQTYLKGFSPDERNVYFYDLNKMVESKIAVPIKSVAYKKYIYEFRNANGEIFAPNTIENCLSKLEDYFNRYRKMILNKAFIKSNYSTIRFLDFDERSFWITYVGLQLLRTPEILSAVTDLCCNEFSMSKNDANNLALMACIPFLGDDYDNNKYVFDFVITPMCNMNISFGVIEDETELFTSDQPIYVFSNNFPCEEYTKIVFPITEKICLFMYGNDLKTSDNDNRLFPLNRFIVDEINWSVAYSANEKIFSKSKLTKEQRNCIYRARAHLSKDKS